MCVCDNITYNTNNKDINNTNNNIIIIKIKHNKIEKCK